MRIQESIQVWIQQRSWIRSLEVAASVSKLRMVDLERKSRREMRPWRSPTARRRWLRESGERSWWGRGCGDQRTEVTKGEREGVAEVAAVDGGGRGIVATNCIEWVSTMDQELSAA